MKFQRYCVGEYINGPCCSKKDKHKCDKKQEQNYFCPPPFPPCCPNYPPPISPPQIPCNQPIFNGYVCIDPIWLFVGGILIGSKRDRF